VSPLISGFTSLYEIMETNLTATTSVQANAPQELTSQVETSMFNTPSMSFGDIGETYDQQMSGYANTSAGVVKFEETKLLERMAKITELTWDTTDLTGSLYFQDVDLALRNYVRNLDVLKQFRYYRSDIEVTIRLNTNLFYYGALMVTLFPSVSTGNYVDERAVLDPTIISASSAESVIKTWRYSWPQMWLPISRPTDVNPVMFAVDILCPLQQAKQDMPDSISIQVWARFVNMELSYPGENTLSASVAQSGNSVPSGRKVMTKKKKNYPTVMVSTSKKLGHPANDKGTKKNVTSSDYKVLQAIENITIGDMVGDATKIIKEFIPLGGVFDKPDMVVTQKPMILEPCSDMYPTDVPDSNVSISLYKDRYVDPGDGRMPMSKDFTYRDYAMIPGLRGPAALFTAQGNSVTIPPIYSHPDDTTYAIPLDFAVLSADLWRGSVNVMLQFITSAFISARFAIEYVNQFDGTFPSDYSNGITKIINVKGDTVDKFKLPWLHSKWWDQDHFSCEVRVTCISKIASSDTVVDPKIFMLVWVAGGEDIQFAYPRVPKQTEWSRVPQSAIGAEFLKSFPPIVENVAYDIDNGYSNNESIGTISSVCKRYGPMMKFSDNPQSFPGFKGSVLDTVKFDSLYYKAFIYTYFGSWRRAFLFRSGGYKWRWWAPTPATGSMFTIVTASGDNATVLYRNTTDSCYRLTCPQIMEYPFWYLEENPSPTYFSITNIDSVLPTINIQHPQFAAARDDLQFGLPILPARYQVPAELTLLKSDKGKELDV